MPPTGCGAAPRSVADDQRALDRAIEQLVFLARAQAGGVCQLGVATQQARTPLRHHALQGVAKFAIQGGIGGQALVVRRVAHHHTGGLRRSLQVADLAHAEPDGLGHAGHLRIFLGSANRMRVHVAAMDHLLERGTANAVALACLGHQLLPAVAVEPRQRLGMSLP